MHKKHRQNENFVFKKNISVESDANGVFAKYFFILSSQRQSFLEGLFCHLEQRCVAKKISGLEI